MIHGRVMAHDSWVCSFYNLTIRHAMGANVVLIFPLYGCLEAQAQEFY